MDPLTGCHNDPFPNPELVNVDSDQLVGDEHLLSILDLAKDFHDNDNVESMLKDISSQCQIN